MWYGRATAMLADVLRQAERKGLAKEARAALLELHGYVHKLLDSVQYSQAMAADIALGADRSRTRRTTWCGSGRSARGCAGRTTGRSADGFAGL